MADKRKASIPNMKSMIRIPETFVVLPLRNAAFFPRQVLPLSVGRQGSLRVLEESERENVSILLLAQREGSVTDPQQSDLYSLGTIARVLKSFSLPDGTKSVLVEGVARARVLSFLQFEPYIKVIAQRIEDERVEDVEIGALVEANRTAFQSVVKMSTDLNDEHLSLVLNIGDAGAVADTIASLIGISVPEKQEILEALDVKVRLQKLLTSLSKIISKLEIGDKIRS